MREKEKPIFNRDIFFSKYLKKLSKTQTKSWLPRRDESPNSIRRLITLKPILLHARSLHPGAVPRTRGCKILDLFEVHWGLEATRRTPRTVINGSILLRSEPNISTPFVEEITTVPGFANLTIGTWLPVTKTPFEGPLSVLADDRRVPGTIKCDLPATRRTGLVWTTNEKREEGNENQDEGRFHVGSFYRHRLYKHQPVWFCFAPSNHGPGLACRVQSASHDVQN